MISRQELILRLSSPLHENETDFAFLNKSSPKTKPASVLIPILDASGGSNSPDWHLLFTRRTDRVADHKGQVSFPGGRADLHDPNPEATALREAYEEIGLAPQDVQIIGKLARLPTITNYMVTPVIGLIPWPYTFILQPEEVSRVFTIPITWLSATSNHETHYRETIPGEPPDSFHEIVYFKPYRDEILWAATAVITLRLLIKLSTP